MLLNQPRQVHHINSGGSCLHASFVLDLGTTRVIIRDKPWLLGSQHEDHKLNDVVSSQLIQLELHWIQNHLGATHNGELAENTADASHRE